MGGAISTRREEKLKKEFNSKLQEKINLAKAKKDENILNTQNTSIKNINKLNIQYKYEKATKSMIHDGEKSQAFSMIGALKYIGVLA